jgi:hypothetical protein
VANQMGHPRIASAALAACISSSANAWAVWTSPQRKPDGAGKHDQ